MSESSANTSNINGKVAWKSPSNIAIVKYWGKYGNQLPRNTSLSFTLSNAFTITSVAYHPKESSGIDIDFTFEGSRNKAFEQRIVRFLDSIAKELPFLYDYHLEIASENSFPHSSGIASSASAMSALCMCLCDIDSQIHHKENIDIQFASHLSRLGSGSASRSVIPFFGLWGHHNDIPNSSNEYAIEMTEVHDVFRTYHDDILIVSAKEKSVSSSAGHQLMEGNVFADNRYQQANDRIIELLEILKKGDVDRFGKLAEDEALTLHALMMCSDPSYILMEPNTIEMINRIRAFRKKSSLPVYFTLDAGPNIHLLYPNHIESEVNKWINAELLELTADGKIIKDKVGNGPEKII